MIKPVKSLIIFICFSWGSLFSLYSNLNFLHNYCDKISLFMSLEIPFFFLICWIHCFMNLMSPIFSVYSFGGVRPLIVSKRGIQEVNFWDFACLKVIILSSLLIIWICKSRLKNNFPSVIWRHGTLAFSFHCWCWKIQCHSYSWSYDATCFHSLSLPEAFKIISLFLILWNFMMMSDIYYAVHLVETFNLENYSAYKFFLLFIW